MSNIQFVALGGLGENGKNMYVLEVDNKIFILDAGLKYPNIDLYGVESVMPDISYLIENKDRVVGIFISHGHEDHIGALPLLLRHLSVGVFGTHFTISLIEDLLTDEGLNIKEYKLYRINEEKVLTFENTSVHFFNTSHSLPESIGIAVKTEDGTIVYAPDFTFNVNQDPRYRTSFTKISDLGKGGTLALLSESLGVNNTHRMQNDSALVHTITDILQHSKRVIFSLFSTDLDRIQKVINVSVENNRKVAVLGRKAQRIINIAMNSGYLKIPEENLVTLRYVDEKNKNDDEDLVVIVTGNRHEPFYMLQRMSQKQDRLIQIQESDRVVLMTPPVPGTERMAAKTIDILNRHECKVVTIKREVMTSSHADSEDLKLLYSILKPKYIIPIIGEYRHQFVQKQIAMRFGYLEDNIIMLDNGQKITFIDQELQKGHVTVESGDVLMDNSLIGDINEVVLKDREMLASEGIVIVALTIDARHKKILAGPELVARGFTFGEHKDEILKDIYEQIEQFVQTHFKKKYVDWQELRQGIRDRVNKQIYRQLKQSPMIIPTVIDHNEKQ